MHFEPILVSLMKSHSEGAHSLGGMEGQAVTVFLKDWTDFFLMQHYRIGLIDWSWITCPEQGQIILIFFFLCIRSHIKHLNLSSYFSFGLKILLLKR